MRRRNADRADHKQFRAGKEGGGGRTAARPLHASSRQRISSRWTRKTAWSKSQNEQCTRVRTRRRSSPPRKHKHTHFIQLPPSIRLHRVSSRRRCIPRRRSSLARQIIRRHRRRHRHCRRRSRLPIGRLLGIHALEIRLQLVSLEDAELFEPARCLGPTGCGGGSVGAGGSGGGSREAHDAEGGVERRELLVLLERVAEGVKTVLDEGREVACARRQYEDSGGGGRAYSLRIRRSGSRGTSWHFGYERRSTWRSIRSSCPRGRTRKGGVRAPKVVRTLSALRPSLTSSTETGSHIVSSDQESNSVRSPSVVLRVDLCLYDHEKEIVSCCRKRVPL